MPADWHIFDIFFLSATHVWSIATTHVSNTNSTGVGCSYLKHCVSAKLVKTRGGSDHFEGGCFGRGSLPHARLRHSRQLVQHLVLHKCCLKITFRDFSPPSVIEIPRDFFVDARNCIPRVCVKISSQKNQKRMRHFEKNLIFRAHFQVSRSALAQR